MGERVHSGWTDRGTAIMAEWIADSTFSDLIRVAADECIDEARNQGCEQYDLLNTALRSFFRKRIPLVLIQRMVGLVQDQDINDPDSFVFPLALVGLMSGVNWEQIAEHWADRLCPVTDIDDLGEMFSSDI